MILKLLNIAELYPPGYAGGAAMYVHDTCQFLAERGHDVRVLCTESNDNPPYSLREEIIEDVKVYRLNLPYFREQDPGGWMLSIAKWEKHCAEVEKIIIKILTDWQPDLIQYHTPYSLIEECFPIIQKKKIPIVGMTHDAWTICLKTSLYKSPTNTKCSGPSLASCLECNYTYWDSSRLKGILKLPWRAAKLGLYPAYKLKIRNQTRKNIDGLICVSQFMEESHKDYANGLIRHIPLGIDLTNLPKNFPSRPRTPLRFGFIGGFVDHKGIWDILDVATSLKKKGYKFELFIWGPNQSESVLINRNIKDIVKLKGLYKPSEIWDAYAEIDILLMATRWAEPYGRVIQEAAAVKVPSIAPRIGGITEQINHEIDGLLFNFREKEDLENQMIKILENPELVEKFTKNLWEVTNTRDAVQEIEMFYLEILNR